MALLDGDRREGNECSSGCGEDESPGSGDTGCCCSCQAWVCSWLPLITVGLAVVAGAAGPSSGSIVPGSAQAVAPFTAGIPFSSGQTINVVIPANSAFASPNNTTLKHRRVLGAQRRPADADLGLRRQHRPGRHDPAQCGRILHLYGLHLFATPDLLIGDASRCPACGQTAATECILFIGNDQNDFTQPHLWSQPFFVKSYGNDSGTNPGDGSPPAVGTVPDPGIVTVVASQRR